MLTHPKIPQLGLISRQKVNDHDALVDLLVGIDARQDALDARVDSLLAALSSVHSILRLVDGRLDALEARLDRSERC